MAIVISPSACWTFGSTREVSVWVRRYAAGDASWTSGRTIDLESDTARRSESPRVAAAADGSAILVWRQSDAGMGNVYARRFDAGASDWASPRVLNSPSEGALAPQVGMDAAGNAVCVGSSSTMAASASGPPTTTP